MDEFQDSNIVPSLNQQEVSKLNKPIRKEVIEMGKGIQIGKKGKLPVFANDMIIYIKDHKNSTRKFLEIVNKSSNLAGYKFNIHKSVTFLYNKTKPTERHYIHTPIQNSNKLNHGC